MTAARRAGLLLAAALASLAACTPAARRGQLADECSGVPGDFRVPADGAHGEVVAHAPGAPGERYLARYRPPTSGTIPSLLIFDEHRNHVYRHTAPQGWLRDPIFERLQNEAFWGEVVDGEFFLVPWFDRCNLQAILEQPIDLRAPRGGLLFVQYVTPRCRDCDETAAAVRAEIARHPDVGFRWVQIDIPPRVGR